MDSALRLRALAGEQKAVKNFMHVFGSMVLHIETAGIQNPLFSEDTAEVIHGFWKKFGKS